MQWFPPPSLQRWQSWRRALAEPTDVLVSMEEIGAALAALGLQPGDTVLAHSGLRNLGWVPGGVQAVISALLTALGDAGTLMMPAHSGHLTEPSRWSQPPVPESWWAHIRSLTPAYDPRLTPTRGLGAIAENFRRWPGVLRSAHPHVSFAAHGPSAEFLTADHQLGSGFGERSPLARLYDLDGKVLLLGVGHGSNTSLHLAEYRAAFPDKLFHQEGAPVMHNGVRLWRTFREQVWHDDDFPEIGAAFAAAGGEKCSPLGKSEVRLMSQPELVDFGVRWMEANRQPLLSQPSLDPSQSLPDPKPG